MATNNFSFGPISITGAGGWILVGVISVGGNRSGMGINIINSGGNAFTHLKLTKCSVNGGQHVDWIGANDSDWASLPAGEFLSVTPAAINTLASAGAAEIHIGNMKGIQEVGIYVQAATTTTATVAGTMAS